LHQVLNSTQRQAWDNCSSFWAAQKHRTGEEEGAKYNHWAIPADRSQGQLQSRGRKRKNPFKDEGRG